MATISAKGHAMDITIAVCTRNRACQLEACLDSITHAIENQNSSVEAIIVDNASTDNTQEIVKRWAARSPFQVNVIVEWRLGLAVSRNTAIRNASGNIMVFTDDDCSLSPDYLMSLANHYAQDTGPVIRGGRVELGDPSDADFTTKKNLRPSRLSDVAEAAGFILGCNMAFPMEAIERVGYFDERFGAGGLFRSAEETDFICRAYNAGIPIEYVPDMTVLHYHSRRNRIEIRKLYLDYCIGNGAIYAKYCFSERRLLRHLYWDARNAILEPFGGRVVNHDLRLTHSYTIFGNSAGLLLYALNWIKVFGCSVRRAIRKKIDLLHFTHAK